MTTPAVPSYVSGTSEKPLLGDTIGDNFDRTVATFGDRDALVEYTTGRRWTYRQLADEVNAVALGLVDLGVGKGDRVGIWAPNCAEWTFTQYATAKIGAILVNINPAYRTHELKYVLNQAGIRTLVAAPSFKTSDYESMIAEVRDECPELTDVILIGREEWTSLQSIGRGG
jgi:fatty-acyl-CoA synthase